MPKTAAVLSCAAILAFAPAAFADEPSTMLGDPGLDSGANVEVPSVMQNGADGDALLGGAEATVVSAGDLGASTMDEKVSLPSQMDTAAPERGSSSSADAWSVAGSSSADYQQGYDLGGASRNADASPFSVSGGSASAASFGGWNVSSSGF